MKVEVSVSGSASDGSCQFSLIKCAIEHCHPRKAVENSIRSYNSFHFITHGSGFIEKNGKKIRMSRGDCFLLFKDEIYQYYPDPSDPWSYIYVDFYVTNHEEVFRLCGFDEKKFYRHYGNYEKLYGVMTNLLEKFKEREKCLVCCEGYFLVLFSVLMEDCRSNSCRPSDRKAVTDEIVIYINNNYRLNLTLGEIANAVGLSPAYVSDCMAKEIGWSPIQYLNVYRVAQACDMIKKGGMNFKDIASAVGYSDPLYFSRVFRKIKGFGPREYAKSHAETDNPYQFLIEKNIDFR